ncbi:hypothetical protein IMG5_182090 [Ichthyophthirius multifiliis]|uniref:Uncharacterized protein n=1 Tax=Ichthyophthirius multifiliis TaxID=5932 RepID=G0R302_ICHMU|nr:hypothetical protein IMG5_182090 [Ichthyophthirius multifiliis]EGR28162.1 hypothetical protein IMG5_182090 [Ichthyophthirius multifiliis]|eukprot:XP_004027507.1 hypothetical protein IMG5_182090 [Ichthyophthirius multifiliis]
MILYNHKKIKYIIVYQKSSKACRLLSSKYQIIDKQKKIFFFFTIKTKKRNPQQVWNILNVYKSKLERNNLREQNSQQQQRFSKTLQEEFERPIPDKLLKKTTGFIELAKQQSRQINKNIYKQQQKQYRGNGLFNAKNNPHEKRFSIFQESQYFSKLKKIPTFNIKTSLGREDNKIYQNKQFAPDYYPNYEYGKKTLGSCGPAFNKIPSRKKLEKQQITYNENFFDYDNYKMKSSIFKNPTCPDFKKILPRERDPNSPLPSFMQNQLKFDSKVYEDNANKNKQLKKHCPNYSLNTNPITSEGHTEKQFKPSIKKIENKISEQKEWKPSVIKTQLSNKETLNDNNEQKQFRQSTNAVYGHYNTQTTEQKEWKPSVQKGEFSDKGYINKPIIEEKCFRNKTNAEYGHYNSHTTTQKEWKSSVKKSETKQNECHIFDEVKKQQDQQPRVNQNNTTTEQKDWKPSIMKVDQKQSDNYEIFNKRGIKKSEFSQSSTSTQNPLVGYDKDEPKKIQKKANNNLTSSVFSQPIIYDQTLARSTIITQKNKGEEAKNLLNYGYSLPFNKQIEVTAKVNLYQGGVRKGQQEVTQKVNLQ